MAHRIVYRPEARLELEQLFSYVLEAAGQAVASAYVEGIIQLIEGLQSFPKRGTERREILPGLRIIGYKRSASIAFIVEETDVIILGVFYGGRNITADLLDERL